MKILCLDIETAPNLAHVWGLFKQNVHISQIMDSSYTMCFSAKWVGDSEIIFDSVFHSSEQKMLSHIHKLLDEADAVVHYNGKRFDIPTLNKEFLLRDMAPPSPYHQIDLLSVAKKRFRFPSNKLDYVAKSLGLAGKVKHVGHDLWTACMAGDEKAWKTMERYNKQDVKLLEQVYEKMLPWIQNHPNHGLYTDSERPVCPNCGSEKVVKKGYETTKEQTYQRYRCSICRTPLRGRFTVLSKEARSTIITQSKL